MTARMLLHLPYRVPELQDGATMEQRGWTGGEGREGWAERGERRRGERRTCKQAMSERRRDEPCTVRSVFSIRGAVEQLYDLPGQLHTWTKNGRHVTVPFEDGGFITVGRRPQRSPAKI